MKFYKFIKVTIVALAVAFSLYIHNDNVNAKSNTNLSELTNVAFAWPETGDYSWYIRVLRPHVIQCDNGGAFQCSF